MISIFSNLHKRGRAILLRGGGLGDFILTLPLLSYMRKHYGEVTLLTKPSYYCLTPVNNDNFQCLDLDLGVQSIEEQIKDSDIFRLPGKYSIARRLIEDWIDERIPFS